MGPWLANLTGYDYETTQIKGDGEAHSLLSPDDEFADYETWDLGNLDMSQAKTREMLPGDYGCKMDTQERAYTSPIWYTPGK